MIHLGGTDVPLKDFTDLLSDVATSIEKHEPLPKAFERIGPDLIPIVLALSGTVVPYSGAAIVLLTLMMKYGKKPTAEDQQRMWDQAQGIR